ncbi:response regulator [Malonomonas rubra]|uniref:response regulator n=1 Tax=Malonomonas rubra TaxID=57040 RepID=UPI0026F2F023|nr:response regulator [Malonomonas rubra]
MPLKPEAACGFDHDACRRVQQRIHELELSEARYQNLFEAVADALFSVDQEGVINRANSACEQVFGRTVETLLGHRFRELFAGYPQIELAYLKSLQGMGQVLELSYLWPNGREIALAIQLSAIWDDEEVSGVLVMAHDLSKEKERELERTRLHEELRTSHRELEAKNSALEESREKLQQTMSKQEKVNAELREVGKMKSDFIGVASHELRTPLTFLFGALEYLQESLPGRINEDEQSLLNYAMQGTQRLSDIVENMLDIVRLETDGFYPQRKLLQLHPFLTHLHSNFSATLTERNLTLDLGNSDTWPKLSVDPQMIVRALDDLIGNAIRYTEPGGTIRIHGVLRSRESLQEDAEWIRLFRPDFLDSCSWEGDFFEIRVADNGVGIPRQELAHVFERFYTVGKLDEHSSGDKFLGKGAGLGLALVKRILHCHDGLSWASSPGAQVETGIKHPGSSFHLLFPHRSDAPAEIAPFTSKRRHRLLLVDDEPAIRRFVEILLNKNYDLELAGNGAEGLQKAKDFNPDLILLDLFMPEMDGFEVFEKLKLDPLTMHTPVAILTAVSRKHEQDRSKELGAVDYITKPFFPRDLLQRIEQLLVKYCPAEKTMTAG